MGPPGGGSSRARAAAKHDPDTLRSMVVGRAPEGKPNLRFLRTGAKSAGGRAQTRSAPTGNPGRANALGTYPSL